MITYRSWWFFLKLINNLKVVLFHTTIKVRAQEGEEDNE